MVKFAAMHVKLKKMKLKGRFSGQVSEKLFLNAANFTEIYSLVSTGTA